MNSEIEPIKNMDPLIDRSIDTLVIGKTIYLVSYQKRYQPVCIIHSQTLDTVYLHHSPAGNGITISDLDANGFQDVQLHQFHNLGGRSELICYDTGTQQFKEVQNFFEYGEPQIIEGTRYWFSEQSRGCHASNWSSELFIIENFKIVEIASMQGFQCGDVKDPGIFIYKKDKRGNDEQFIERISLDSTRYDQWGFLNRYWKRNLDRFIN